MSPRRDSNPRPTDYKSVALPAELQRLKRDAKVVYRKILCNTLSGNFKNKAYPLEDTPYYQCSDKVTCSMLMFQLPEMHCELKMCCTVPDMAGRCLIF